MMYMCDECSSVVIASRQDGAFLYRVVLFKSSMENFRKGLKDTKCSLREFEYSADAYRDSLTKFDQLNTEFEKTERSLKFLCSAAFSDTLVAWMHLKVGYGQVFFVRM